MVQWFTVILECEQSIAVNAHCECCEWLYIYIFTSSTSRSVPRQLNNTVKSILFNCTTNYIIISPPVCTTNSWLTGNQFWGPPVKLTVNGWMVMWIIVFPVILFCCTSIFYNKILWGINTVNVISTGTRLWMVQWLAVKGCSQ